MRRAGFVLLPLAVILGLVLWREQGPAPRTDEAPRSQFSAARAMSLLRMNLAEGVPHPAGSVENERVRARIESQLRTLGYETFVQRRFACNAHAVCAQVENLIARPRGATGPTVLVVAHYDSVGAGPGASDDGVGVAVLLEIARAVRQERFRNAIAFLIDDGEEAGLLGAEGFVADPGLVRDVRVVINVENRGTYGLSNMFETSRGNRWLIRHLARALDRPAASSLFYAIYNLLPNDTDITVFKRHGIAAVNFAAIRGVQWYHTPLDDVSHANARTVQHHGDNVLWTLRALANADLDARSNTDATYFDVLGFFLVWWPQEWTLWLGFISLAVLVYGARKMPPREMTYGVLAAFATILLALLGGTVLARVARLRSMDMNFVATPAPSIVAMWLIGIAAALLGAALFRRRAQPRTMLLGIAIVWHMIGIALALTVGGAAFLFIVPSVVLALGSFAGTSEVRMAAYGSSAAAIVFFPLGVALYDALGGRLMMVIAVLIGIVASLVAPLFPRVRAAGIVAGAALVFAILAAIFPASTKSRPQRLSLAYVDDSASSAPQWIADSVPKPLRSAAAFAPGDPRLTPWAWVSAWTAPAPRNLLSRVAVDGTRNGGLVTVRVRSTRGANRLSLRVHGGNVLRINGVTPPPRPARFRDFSRGGWGYASAIGVEEMTVEVAAPGPVEAVASDMTFGLPASGDVLARARDLANAIAAQEGDVTITRARSTF